MLKPLTNYSLEELAKLGYEKVGNFAENDIIVKCGLQGYLLEPAAFEKDKYRVYVSFQSRAIQE